MSELTVRTYSSYEEFAEAWSGSGKETRMTWQLLDQIADDEILVEIPQWLADKKVGYTQGSVPTAFVGRIATESEDAVQLADSAAAKSLRKLAHRISQLEQSDNTDNKDWLDDRLADHREQFTNRVDAVSMDNEWLPKSEILQAIERDD